MTADMLDPGQLGAEAVAAERSLLGALLTSPDIAADVWTLIEPDQFWMPLHATLAGLMRDMHRAHQPVDLTTVNGECQRRGLMNQTQNGVYLFTLFEQAFAPLNWKSYASDVIASHRRRRLFTAGQRACQQALNLGTDVDVSSLLLMEAAEDLATERMRKGGVPAPTLDEFLAQPSDYDWVVEGLLERGDRLMITGGEGLGKSELCRQFAVTLAAGIHPFNGRPMKPLKVLYVDCENGTRHMRRRMKPLWQIAMRANRDPGTRLRVLSHPSGVDLVRPDDQAFLLEQVSLAAPDVLVVGPLYRLYTGSVNDEDVARAVTVALDAARARGNCAVVIEAHAPHSESGGVRVLRPRGSSLWMGWPEFGIGIRPAVDGDVRVMDVEPWRGARDERDFPEAIRRGWDDDEWPWVATLSEVKQATSHRKSA